MICWDRVNNLRDEVGIDDFAEVVEIFVEEVDEVVSRLGQCPDPSTYEAELHFLKGSALNLGFSALSDLCGQGEILARSLNHAEIDLPAVINAYQKSKIEFIAGLKVMHAA